MNHQTINSTSQRMETRYITGNRPLLLTDSEVIWQIQSGSVALFTTRMTQGEVAGDRRYLFNVNQGEALFGTAPLDRTNHLGMMAIPLEPTQVLALPPASLPPLLETWIHKLGQTEGLPKPKVMGNCHAAQYVSLLKGQLFHAPTDRVLWVRIQQGQAHWLGYPELKLTATTGYFPLGQGMWLEAEDHLELMVCRTDEVDDPQVWQRGLSQLHLHFLRCVELLQQKEAEAVIQQFQARQHLDRQVTESTLRTLASVLHNPQDDFLLADSALLIAAGAVGKALGVTIQPPMKSEEMKRIKEPLEAVARASRLRLRRVLLRGNWWQQDGTPLLAYTRGDRRPVALIPVAGSRYELFDPVQAGLVDEQGSVVLTTPPKAAALRTRVNEQIAANLDPVAYLFYRPLPDGKIEAIDLLKFAFQGRRRDVLTILLTGIAATLLGMLVPQATAVLVNEAIPYSNEGLLTQIGVGLLAAAVGGTVFHLAQAVASMRIETVSDASLQAAVWDRLLKLRTSFFRQYSVGDLNSRVSGIGAIRRTLSGTALQSLFTGFFALLNLGLLFYYSSQLAVLALVVAIGVMVFTILSGAILIRKNRPLLEQEGDLVGVVVQLVNGVPKLRMAGGEERAFAYWGQKYTRQLQLLLSTQRLEDAVAVFNTTIPTLTTIALFWLASTLITPGQMNGSSFSTGTFLAFSIAYGIFIAGVTNLSNTVIEVLDIVPLWQRSAPILTAQPEVDCNKADPGRLTGRISIDHVSFRYREEGALILDDVTIQVEPGEFIALVGTSGSGKSTLFRLLLGFDTPMSGTVHYDGQDLAGLDVTAVRRQLGVVLQNSRINAGSMFENIASGALISMDEAWTAAEMSGLAEDIRAMPMQMHTVISEGGTNLSGGQRQRLIIARALALKPRILFLDEATSALDNRTQSIVSQSLDHLRVTRIVIAHRLSTIRHADRIYVLGAGRITQQGRFEELAEQPGLFAELVRRQMA